MEQDWLDSELYTRQDWCGFSRNEGAWTSETQGNGTRLDCAHGAWIPADSLDGNPVLPGWKMMKRCAGVCKSNRVKGLEERVFILPGKGLRFDTSAGGPDVCHSSPLAPRSTSTVDPLYGPSEWGKIKTWRPPLNEFYRGKPRLRTEFFKTNSPYHAMTVAQRPNPVESTGKSPSLTCRCQHRPSNSWKSSEAIPKWIKLISSNGWYES